MKFLVLAIAAALVVPMSLAAGVITVPNSSFEEDPPGFGNPTGWTLFDSTTSPTFTDNSRVVTNNGGAYPITSGVVGSQFVAVNLDHNFLSPGNPTPVIPPDGSLDGLVSDNLGTFAADMVYTLSANIGLSQALSSLDVGLALGTGMPSLADVFPAPSHPTFASVLVNGSLITENALQTETITLNTESFLGLVGQPINVSLIFHSEYEFGRQALFDDVSLSSALATPEPCTLILLGTAGLITLLGRAKARSARACWPARPRACSPIRNPQGLSPQSDRC